MNTYIQKDIEGFYVEDNINESLCGYTYEDFLNGKYIKLEQDQVDYHRDHPEADIETVLNVAIYQDDKVTWYFDPHPEITIEQAKEWKLQEVTDYDNSDAVNDFIINNTIHAWFTPEERSNYKSSVESAKLLGVSELSLYIGENLFTIPTQQAELMLAQIQLYADNCFMVTKTHKINIELKVTQRR